MIYRPLPNGLTIQKSTVDGLGLFTTKELKKNLNLGVTHVAMDTFPNGYIRTPLGGFYNHSDDPNCILHNAWFRRQPSKYVNSATGKRPVYKYLMTLRKILPGEELTVKYTLYEIKK